MHCEIKSFDFNIPDIKIYRSGYKVSRGWLLVDKLSDRFSPAPSYTQLQLQQQLQLQLQA